MFSASFLYVLSKQIIDPHHKLRKVEKCWYKEIQYINHMKNRTSNDVHDFMIKESSQIDFVFESFNLPSEFYTWTLVHLL